MKNEAITVAASCCTDPFISDPEMFDCVCFLQKRCEGLGLEVQGQVGKNY